jgi:tRNA threonylcarbamoyladenosine biosynthesis protein TsaE
VHIERSDAVLAIHLQSEAETDRLGRALAEVVVPGVVIGLVGTLGAGKTRLTRAIAEGLGVDPGSISSPTFVLIHEYEGRIPVYHFDAYRLASADEFDALGAGDYFAAGDGLCLVEWADRVVDRLPHDAWLVSLETTGPHSRRAEVRFPRSSDHSEQLLRLLSVV